MVRSPLGPRHGRRNSHKGIMRNIATWAVTLSVLFLGLLALRNGNDTAKAFLGLYVLFTSGVTGLIMNGDIKLVGPADK